MIIEHFFLEKNELFSALNDHCMQSIQDSFKAAIPTLVYLSGGSTPAPLYKMLARSAIDFSTIRWAMVDERWVDTTSTHSNQHFINECFAESEGFRLVPMKNTAKTPKLGLPELEFSYGALPKRSTICILGMGNDGHTASFFPHAEGLALALDAKNTNRVAAITAKLSAVTGNNLERTTLTLNRILDSDNLILLLTGDKKYQVFREALQQNDIFHRPLSALLRQDKTNVHVYWCP